MTIGTRFFRASVLIAALLIVVILAIDHKKRLDRQSILDHKAQQILNREQDNILNSFKASGAGDPKLIDEWRVRFQNPSRTCLDALSAIDKSAFDAGLKSAIKKCDESLNTGPSLLWWTAGV